MKVVVGIPSYNNAETISHVARTAAQGIVDFFDGDGMIVNSDGGSADGTRERFMETDTFGLPKESFVYEGIPGKGSAMRAIMEFALKQDAEAVVFLDADLRSVKPWWVERLAGPVLKGEADYVTPFYLRHRFDGTITNNVCFPLTAVLYGKKVRQPIGGDFGVGRKLLEIYLGKPKEIWNTDIARFGIDIWMTTTAINESGKVVQATLGTKVHDVKDPGKHLKGMFLQVVGTLFELVITYENAWKEIWKIEDVPIYGETPQEEVPPMSIDIENLKKLARETLEEVEYIDRGILSEVKESGTLSLSSWVDTLYRSAVQYRKTRDKKVVENLLPFYFARTARFAEEVKSLSDEEAERYVYEQLGVFLEKKHSFREEWEVEDKR
ncbi:glycosyltransferase [Thermotoga sp. 38H-to]|uniref:glycosyltransferase n=1 Tax=Thermotoga sp. 38H-to TaxID=1755812 RepID=UPI0013ED10E8|nr:glycosyltransferase [Thermotoga sp. 38H-to]KAF2960211.1 glycosyltransferase [Thermotoga sp. 38H-to]